MNKYKNNFWMGIFFLIFSQAFIKLLGMIHTIYLTNKEGFGDIGNAIYMSGFQIYILVLTICSIGIPNTISKLVAEKIGKNDLYNSKKILKVSFYIFGGIGFLGSIIMYNMAEYIAMYMLEIPEAKYTLMALSPSIFFVTVNSVFRGFFCGIKSMETVAKMQAIEQFFKTLITIIIIEIIAIISKNNTVIMAASANIATTISTIITFIYVIKYFTEINKRINNDLRNKINKKEKTTYIIRRIFYLIIPFSLTSMISALNKNIDSMTVVKILNPIIGENLARIKYGILSSKIDLLISMPLAFNSSIIMTIIPEISSLNIKNDKEIKDKIKNSLLISNIISIPCFCGMFLYSNEIINFLFPKASIGGDMLKIASFTIIFSILIQTISVILQALNYTKYPIIALSIGTLLKLTFNILFIPLENLYEKGAILSTILSNIIVFIILISKLEKEKNILKDTIMDFIKIVLITFFMGFSSYIIFEILKRMFFYNNFVFVIIIFYCISIYLFMIFKCKIIKINEKDEYY